MTGIERLRDMAHIWNSKVLAGIADQIEREMAPKTDTSPDADEQNPSWHDPADAADVTFDAAKVTRGPSADVSMSAYDLLPQEDRDAIAWVREHGAVDAVKAHWEECVPASWLEKAKRRYELKRDRLKAHAWELERKCSERRERIKELERNLAKSASDQLKADSALYDLSREVRDVCKAHGIDPGEDPLGALDDALDSRLMPEGMEWPTVDGKPVDFVTGYEPSLGVLEAVSIYSNGACEVMGHDGIIKGVKEIHVVTPKVLDADGVDTSVGDTVYDVDTGEKMWVCALPEQGAYQCVKLRLANGMFKTLDPCRFTHERPDSLDRLAEDIGAMVVAWRSNKDLFDAQLADAGCVGENTLGAALDSLVFRIKALAGDA